MPQSATGPAWLVLPTYNEAENIEAFLDAARAKLPTSAHVLIVDDSSPDGTGEIADRLAERHENVSVLHRPRKGRARPRLHRRLPAGALPRAAPRWCWRWTPTSPTTRPTCRGCWMRRERADLVIGSRYVAGRRSLRLGHAAPGDQPRRQRLRAVRARGRGARPDRRLQVLSPRGAGGGSTSTRSRRTAMPSRWR